jgi:hypothetical protein
MEIDRYFENLDALSLAVFESGKLAYEFIEEPGDMRQMVGECITSRESQLTQADDEKYRGLLETGFFPGDSEQKRIAAFALSSEVQGRVEQKKSRQHCELYHQSQALFNGAPDLWERIRRKENDSPDLELIDLNAAIAKSESEIFQVKGGYAKLSRYLNPGIVNWARKVFPKAPIFVRLDPHEYYAAKPRQYLTEATLAPARPGWLHDFQLRKGMKEFASYILEPGTVESMGFAGYWDYHVRMVRRLEIYAKRRDDDYFSMMIEEIPSPDEDNELMIARCIHLDTRCPVGTPFGQIKLQHLDLAINVYEGPHRQERFGETLQGGMVRDATFRTHLFRIENVPLSTLFIFCGSFLQSNVLLGEWLHELIV